jgi:PAS domain S-box-containing protein
MQHIFTELDFGRWQVLLLSVLPALVVGGLFVYSGRSLHRTRMNFFFSLFLLVSAGWMLADGGMHLSTTRESATEWFILSEIFVIFVVAFGMLFMAQFADWQNRFRGYILSVLLLLPAQVFFMMIFLRMDAFEIVASPTWYWVSNPVPTPITLTILLWVSAASLVMLFIPWSLYFRRENPIEKKKALLIGLGLSVPVLLGVGGEIMLPLTIGANDVPLGAPAMVVFACFAFIAVEKYQLLDYSPKHQWQQITNMLNDGIIIVDNNENIVYANPTFCELTGYSLEEIKGKNAGELLLSERDRNRMMTVIDQRLNGESGRYEHEIRTKSGEKVWVIVKGLPYLDRYGNVVGSIGVQTNINELKKKEKELIHSRERLKQAQSVARVGSWEVDFPSGTAVWSEEACRIYGIPQEQCAKQTFESWLAYLHPDDLGHVLTAIHAGRQDNSDTSIFHRIVRSDGEVRFIHSVTQVEFTDGVPTGLFGICHDITEQKKVEDALAESEALNRTFVNESSLCIMFVEPLTGKIRYANPAFYALTGYRADDDLTPDQLLTEPAEAEQWFREAVNTGRTLNREMVWQSRSGKLHHMLASAVYKEVNGSSLIYLAAQDITARIKAEESLKAVNAELETFIYKASHDLRGPLASIMGLVNVSKMEPPGKTKVYLEMIETASMKLDDTLLQLTRAMKLKGMEKFSEPVEFRALVEEVLKRFEFFEGYARMRFDINVGVTGAFVTNRAVLETVVQNLIENAIKYQSRGDIKPFLKIEVLENARHVKLIFEDNGIGIDENVQKSVFDMYFRGTELSQGSGLGLYLVKKGVELLKGEISLRSAPGKGTVVAVLLPKREEIEKEAVNPERTIYSLYQRFQSSARN